MHNLTTLIRFWEFIIFFSSIFIPCLMLVCVRCNKSIDIIL